MDHLRYLTKDWYTVPKAIFRLCFIILNNAYCIPTYVVWMVLLSPLRKVNPDIYWKIEGYFFHWLLAMVSMWSWSAGYEVVEMGDDIRECLDDRTLVIANHQSTGDVPLLMATFNPRKQILPNICWIMDSLFKYTNFGIVSVIHQDFFIMSGKNKRDKSLQELMHHLLESYIPLTRKWLVLFPEGGFLRKRKAASQKYAVKNNLPSLHYVTIPRIGAMQTIMDTLSTKSFANNNSTSHLHVTTSSTLSATENTTTTPTTNGKNQIENNASLNWILDITIGYPKGQPLDLIAIILGHRPPCKTTLFYRLYPCKNVPQNSNELTQWLFERWEEKERMLDLFYKTGKFFMDDDNNKFFYNRMPQLVEQDCLRFFILHLFFILSTYVHIKLLLAAYHYCNYLIY